MKKFFHSFVFVGVVALLLATMGQPVHASSVSYENQAERFVFVPESTDLFENFKGVMPGDSVEQEILVKNGSLGPVKIYLRINPIRPEDEAFLKELTLSIQSQGVEYFNETLDQQGQFDEFVLLAELNPQQEKALNLVLDVPLSLSSEFMDMESTIEWVFKVVDDEEVSDLPDTGTTSQGVIYLSGGVLIALGLLLITKKPTRNR